jgi:hypothetical protein
MWGSFFDTFERSDGDGIEDLRRQVRSLLWKLQSERERTARLESEVALNELEMQELKYELGKLPAVSASGVAISQDVSDASGEVATC